MPPSALTTLMKLSKLSSTKCWIGIPKSSSMAAMSWSGPWYERGIDLVGAVGAGVGHEEVAGDRQDRQRVVRRVEVQDHHHVAVDAVDALRAQPVGGVLHRERAARRRADHEDVLRAGVGALHRRRGEVAQIDAVDLVVEVPAVAGRCAGDEHDDQQQGAPDPGRGATPRAPLGGGVRGTVVCRTALALLAPPPPAASAPVRLVDLATELLEAPLDRVHGGFGSGRSLVGVRLGHVLPEPVEALVDWVVLGIGRTHGGVLSVTRRSCSDGRLRPSRQLRWGRPERDQSLAIATRRMGVGRPDAVAMATAIVALACT